MRTFAVTRAPEHDGADGPRDDFLIVVDGEAIGSTYWGPAYEGPGKWHSWGPAGLSMGHLRREDAEQAQVRAYALNPDLSDRVRADERRRREAETARQEAELARQQAERAERDRRRRLGDDEPGPVIWALPACHHLYAPLDEVRAVAAWLADHGIEDLSGWQEARLEQRAGRLALVYEAPTELAMLAIHIGARGNALVDHTETHAVTVTTAPPPITVPPRPDLRLVFNEHYPTRFPLIDFGFGVACAACTQAAKAVRADQMIAWPCEVVAAAIDAPAEAVA
jgi:hypothetical protein